MIKICICDDKSDARLTLREMITGTGLFENAEYSFYECGDALTADYEKGIRYDFVFLDVDLPGMNGIEVGKFINACDSKALIIFVTSFPQYAIDAFECNAFHYLLKNSDRDRFLSVLSRASEKYRLFRKYYVIKTADSRVTLDLSDICYIECCRKKLLFHTDTAVYTTRENIGDAYEKVCDFGFFMTHQGYIVNFSKVHHFTKTDAVLKSGMTVPVSIRKRTEVIAAYNKYIERYIV